MNKYLALSLASLVLMSACSSNKKPEPVKLMKPLEFPQDMQLQPSHSPYPIPLGNYQAAIDTPRPKPLDEPETAVATSQEDLIEMRQDGNGMPVLVMTMSFSDAWEALVASARQSDYGLADLDRSSGTLYLNSWVGREINQGRDRVLRRQSDRQYQLQVMQTTDNIQIAVQVDVNELADPETSRDILNDIREKLDV